MPLVDGSGHSTDFFKPMCDLDVALDGKHSTRENMEGRRGTRMRHVRVDVAALLSMSALVLCGMLLPARSHATHMSGGEIYWDCIGPNQFEITLVVYRDCAGIQLDPNYDLQVQSPCDTLTLNVSTPGGTEISQLCDIELPNSTCNGGNLPGIEQYIYTGTITLPPCDSWTISWTEIYRNNAIANLVNPGNKEMYIEAVMNNVVAPCDDSPQFTNIAIPYICAGFPISYSYGVFDPEGDSLVYSLIGARVGGAGPIPYVIPHSGTSPIPGITIDPSTGLVNFSLAVPGNWVVVVLVEIYDGQGQLIGSVMRDMQFIAYPCANIPPDPTTGTVGPVTGSGVQTGSYAVEVCESGDFCFDMVISDPNAANLLTATTNVQQNLPGATFTYSGTNPITCTVCWTASAGSGGFFPFIVNVSDGACPIPAFQTYVYSINVLEGLFVDVQVTDETCMGAGNGTASASVTIGTAPFNFLWDTGDTTPAINAASGTYSVSVTDANGCTTTDPMVTIQPGPTPPSVYAGPDQIICSGDLPVVLNGTAQNHTSATWSGGQGTFTGTGTTGTYAPTATELTSGNVALFLTATGAAGCPGAQDTIALQFSSGFPNATLAGTDPTCAGMANGSVSFSPVNAGYSFQWDDPNASTTPVVAGLSAGNYTLLVTDALGCDSSFQIQLNEPLPLSIDGLLVGPITCNGASTGTAQAFVSGGSTPYQITWFNGGSVQTGPTATGLAAGTTQLGVSDASGCSADTTFTLDQPDPIALTANIPDTLCVNAPAMLSAQATGGTAPYTYTWVGIGQGASVTHAFASSQTVTVNVSDNAGCNGPQVALDVFVLDATQAQLQVSNDTTVCMGGTAMVSATLFGYPGSVQVQWPTLGQSGPGPFSVPLTQNMDVPVQITTGCGEVMNDVIQLVVEQPLSILFPAVWAEGCADLTVDFPDTLAPGAVAFAWDFGDGNTSSLVGPVHTFGPGTWPVTLTVTTALGCMYSAAGAGAVIAYPGPTAEFSASPWHTDLDEPLIQFTNGSTGNIVDLSWEFGDGVTSNIEDPTHEYFDVGTFQVTLSVEDMNGCVSTVTHAVIVDAVHEVVVPNAFSPTGTGGGYYDPTDLSNDIFYPFARSVEDMNMRIYDRWGELIFESNEQQLGWDGTYRGELSPQDVYVYQITVRFVDGKEVQRIGDLTLFR